jgi:hypothetical protein
MMPVIYFILFNERYIEAYPDGVSMAVREIHTNILLLSLVISESVYISMIINQLIYSRLSTHEMGK